MKITPVEGYPLKVGKENILLAELEWGFAEPTPKAGDTFIKWNLEWTIQRMNPHVTPVLIRATSPLT